MTGPSWSPLSFIRTLFGVWTRLTAYAVRLARSLYDVSTIIKAFPFSSGVIVLLLVATMHGAESNGLAALSPLIALSGTNSARDEAERNSKVKDQEIPLGGPGVHAFLYIRVSTWAQALMGLSPTVQFDKLLSMKDMMEVLPAHLSVLVDLGRSGFSSQRKIFIAIAKELKKGCGRPHEIWITSVDRLGRDSWYLVGFFVFFLGTGGRIRTPEGTVYSRDDPWSLARFVLEAIGADLPTRSRIKASIDSKKNAFYQRREWNVKMPFGFEGLGNWIRQDSSPLIRDAVVFIFETFAEVKAVPALNEAIHRKFGFELNEEKLLRMLGNAVYIGRPDPYSTGTPVIDQSIRFKEVTDGLFAEVQAILRKNRDRHLRRDEYDTQQIVFENLPSFWRDFVPWATYHARLHGGPIVSYGGGSLSGRSELRARCMGTDSETGKLCGVRVRLPKRNRRDETEEVEWTDLLDLDEGEEKTRPVGRRKRPRGPDDGGGQKTLEDT